MLALRLSARKSETKKKLRWSPLERLGKYKNVFMPEIIFSKKEFQIWDFESFIFWSKFFLFCFGFFLTALGRFSQCYLIFCRRPTVVTDIFTPDRKKPPDHKKPSYGPAGGCFCSLYGSYLVKKRIKNNIIYMNFSLLKIAALKLTRYIFTILIYSLKLYVIGKLIFYNPDFFESHFQWIFSSQ